jgi:hypothetical protein
VAKWFVLGYALLSYTLAGASFLTVSLQTDGGIILAEILVPLPLATSVVEGVITGTFGGGGMTLPPVAGGILNLVWAFTTNPSASTSRAYAVVGY